MKCGQPLAGNEEEYCADCGHTHHYYDRGYGLWLHRKPVSNSIYRFKFHNQRAFGAYYARELAGRFEEELHRWGPDFLVPIPLHPRKERQRGYNQALILVRELGRLTGIPVRDKLLRRVRYTTPQKKLGHRDRRQNLLGAFRVSEPLEKGAVIVLVDDIYTTGNTISAAAKALKEAGAEKVFFLTISIGQGY